MKCSQLVIVLIFSFCANTALTADARNHKVLSSLQKELNEALTNDKEIILIEGKDFESEVGTVIFISRTEGMKRMVDLAREGKNELSVMYLPRWRAWITESVERAVDNAKNDLRYRKAALKTEARIELWHTHSSVGVEAQLENRKKREERALFWITPSLLDLWQLYDCAENNPKENFVGVIATPYGALSFWSTEYRALETPFNPIYGDLVERSYISEVENLQLVMSNAQPKDIAKLAGAYRGIFFLKFEPIP